jgi:hypothetical protein
MTDKPKPTLKGRLIAFGTSALLCAVAIEGFAWVAERRAKQPVVDMQLNLQPYMMFVSTTSRHPIWLDLVNKTEVPSQMTFNNLGFNVASDFAMPLSAEVISQYAKKPGEKLVLITGGSVVHGVGATSNEKTTAARLEATLNARQSTYKYRVINLGMGSWIAYQQFLGLSLFGLALEPDWIVTMDGHNDAAVTCPHGSGASNPMSWPQMLYLTGGGAGVGRRGPLMQWLIENTSIARLVTGARPEEHNPLRDRVYFDETDPDKRFLVKLRDVKAADLDKQVEFYVLAQRNVKELFSSANIIFSSQPILANNAVSPWYRRAFEFGHKREDIEADKGHLKADLDNFMKQTGETRCGVSLAAQSLGYFMARSALRMEKVASEWAAESTNRSIRYRNVETIFPGSAKLRAPNFIDNAHMSDLGQRRTAEYFAGYILETDLKVPFNPAAFVQSVQTEAVTAGGEVAPATYAYSPLAAPQAKPVGGNRILEGLTAKERSPGALELAETRDAGFHRVLWGSVPTAPGKDNTLTVDVWSDTVAVVRLEMLDNAKSYGRADLDLVTHKALAMNGNKVAAQVQDLGKGWKRVALTLPLAGDVATLGLALMYDDQVAYPGSNRSIVITEPALALK